MFHATKYFLTITIYKECINCAIFAYLLKKYTINFHKLIPYEKIIIAINDEGASYGAPSLL